MNRVNRVLRLIAVVGAASVVMAACGGPQSPSAQPDDSGNERPSQKGNEPSAGAQPSADLAPEFTVTTFDGAAFSLADRRGTPVVLNFWESW